MQIVKKISSDSLDLKFVLVKIQTLLRSIYEKRASSLEMRLVGFGWSTGVYHHRKNFHMQKRGQDGGPKKKL